ncbi:MAG: hypothetical protein ACO3P0_04095 [Quisquiliibacterium sp.]
MRRLTRDGRSFRPSGRTTPLKLVRGAPPGCDGYLDKPVMLPSLRGTL